MALFDAVPALNLVLKVISAGYLLWLGFKIATAAPLEERDADSRSMTFLQAATFQWVNPKAWAMCLSAITLYAPDRSLLSVAIVAAAFTLVCFPAISVWAWLGTVVRQWLSNQHHHGGFAGGIALSGARSRSLNGGVVKSGFGKVRRNWLRCPGLGPEGPAMPLRRPIARLASGSATGGAGRFCRAIGCGAFAKPATGAKSALDSRCRIS
ncbi:LysE family translocator [Rhodovulum sulfidophilum]|uniref:LysE family translocator n=1 Tax=Rhodovulum sulfidophilum TaxID=35806 RepID=UPI003075B2AB